MVTADQRPWRRAKPGEGITVLGGSMDPCCSTSTDPTAALNSHSSDSTGFSSSFGSFLFISIPNYGHVHILNVGFGSSGPAQPRKGVVLHHLVPAWSLVRSPFKCSCSRSGALFNPYLLLQTGSLLIANITLLIPKLTSDQFRWLFYLSHSSTDKCAHVRTNSSKQEKTHLRCGCTCICYRQRQQFWSRPFRPWQLVSWDSAEAESQPLPWPCPHGNSG